MLYFSVIIPVFNRPDEVFELLESLALQTNKNFEVLIVEDGSEITCENIVNQFSEKLNIQYFSKVNEGPGLSRNYGALRAKGNYFVFFDSDCIIPPNYFQIVTDALSVNYTNSYGGPDMAHPSFSDIQKAISFSMTSFFTTGGIRGGKKSLEKFHPRSFNMGFSKEVFEKTGGYSKMRFGEDIDLSLRILEAGFTAQLIQQAAVYHKRRVDFRKFFKQVHNSGIARINLYKRHPKSLKMVHFLPTAFVCGTIFLLFAGIFFPFLFGFLVFYFLLLWCEAFFQYKNFKIAFLAIPASIVQLFGYGSGFLISFWKRIVLHKSEFHAFSTNFYK